MDPGAGPLIDGDGRLRARRPLAARFAHGGWSASRLSALHAVYFPYWLAGIQNWHYVFETGPLFVMIFAVTTQQLLEYWKNSRRKLMPIWWSALDSSAIITDWLPFDPFWNSRLDGGIEELAFSRVKYKQATQQPSPTPR